jgi:hypothetical protein
LLKNYKKIFGNININLYLEAAEKFLPENKINTIFIFESPPFEPPFHPISNKYNEKWSYFYNYKSDGSDNLRRIICRTLFNEKMDSAKGFLEKFSNQGYFLVDAVNYPIDDIIKESKHLIKVDSKNKVHPDERVEIIYSEADELVKTIDYWVGKSKSNLPNIKMIVVKATVFKGLFTKNNKFKEKVDDGIFNVLNDSKIDYPLFNINTFKEVVRKLLNLNF